MSGGAEREYSRAFADDGVVHGDGFTMRQADDCPGRTMIDPGGMRTVLPGLTFRELQHANRERGKEWGKGKDIPALFNPRHAPARLAVELAGEVGELMNEIKKQARYELGIAGGKHPEEASFAIEDELGDVVICCSLLANKLGIDLGQCVAEKFNKTSEKHGFPHRLAA